MTSFEKAMMGLIFLVCVVFVFMIIPVINVRKVDVPVVRSLNTQKYVVLKEDTLTVNGMTIKRIYYWDK